MEKRQQRLGHPPSCSKDFGTLPRNDKHRQYISAAGIDYVDDKGRYADFHALRHTFITGLLVAGVNPRAAQELARHTDLKLTTAQYTNVLLFDTSGAIATLPAPESPIFGHNQ